MSFIFLNYLATEEEREEYNKIIKNNEEQYQNVLNKKYSIDNIFNKRKTSINLEQKNIEERQDLPIEYKKNFFEFILSKIKKLLGRFK